MPYTDTPLLARSLMAFLATPILTVRRGSVPFEHERSMASSDIRSEGGTTVVEGYTTGRHARCSSSRPAVQCAELSRLHWEELHQCPCPAHVCTTDLLPTNSNSLRSIFCVVPYSCRAWLDVTQLPGSRRITRPFTRLPTMKLG